MPGDGAGDQDAASSPGTHVAADALNEVESSRNIGVDDVAHLVEFLIEERATQPMARIGEERFDRPPIGCGV
jgi:hypothetical protein